jgi:predicted NBD/HSP70 family sugar kinase
MQQHGTFQLMKKVNKRTILNKIRLSDPISRAEIAKQTGITAPTVGTIVKELIEEELVVEQRSEESTGGRKPKLLSLNKESNVVISLDASSKYVRGALCNIVGEILYQKTIQFKGEEVTYLRAIKNMIHFLIKEAESKPVKLLGICLAVPGIIEGESGKVTYCSHTNFHDIPLKEELKKTFDYPVVVENNSRAMAFGEYWFKEYSLEGTLLVLNIGRGVGAGIISNGQLLYGPNNVAGEVGHMTIDLNGRYCSCGNRGCWERYITGKAIVERAQEEVYGVPNPLTASMVYTYAKRNIKEYQKVLSETGKIIGVGLVNLINILNPDHIVLGGGVMNSHEYLLPEIMETIEANSLLQGKREELSIELSSLGEHGTLLGVAALFFKEFF